MRQAANALFSVPHPEEPDESLPSFVSGVTMGARGPTFWFDIADAEVYDGLLEQVLETVVQALEQADATGLLGTPEDATRRELVDHVDDADPKTTSEEAPTELLIVGAMAATMYSWATQINVFQLQAGRPPLYSDEVLAHMRAAADQLRTVAEDAGGDPGELFGQNAADPNSPT